MTPSPRNLDDASNLPDPTAPQPFTERVLPYDPAEWEAKLAIARARREKVLQERMNAARSGAAKPTRPDPGAAPAPKTVPGAPVAVEAPEPANRATGLNVRRRIHPRPVTRDAPGDTPARARVSASVPLWLAVLIGIGLAIPLALLLTRVEPPQLGAPAPAASNPKAAAMVQLPVAEAPVTVHSVPAPPPPAADAIQVTLSKGVADPPAAIPPAAPVIAAAPPEPPVADLAPPPPPVQTAESAEPVSPPPATPRPDPRKVALLDTTSTLRLHVPQKPAGPAAASATAALREAGFTDVVVARSPFTIRETQVRYYHKQDAGAAALAAGQTGALLRDFTGYAPKPALGVIEIWMAGSSPGAGTTTRPKTAGSDLAELNPGAMVRSIGSAFSDLFRTFPHGNER